MALLSSSDLVLSSYHGSYVSCLSLSSSSVPVLLKSSTRKKTNHHSDQLNKMFRSVTSEGHLSGGQSSSSAAGPGVTSPGLDSQESSWIGLLSVFSRPAWSFLQKYLPGRPRAPALSESRAGWISGDLNPGKTMFVDEEREFLRQLDDMMPLTQHAAPHLTYLRCQQDSVAGLLEPEGGPSLPWLMADSLREIGIQSAEDMDFNLVQQSQMEHLSPVRTFLSHVWLSSVSSQEIKSAAGTDWVSQGSGGKSRTWWGSLLGGEESSQRGLLSDLSLAEDRTKTGRLCPQPSPRAETKAAQTATVFVQSGGGGGEWTLGENTGPSDYKEQPHHNGGLHSVQNTEGSTSDRRLSITDHLNASGAAATATACSEVALLTPDQDNGYSSLEEEHVHMCQLFMVNTPRDPPPLPPQEAESDGTRADGETDMEEETSEDGESTGNIDEEEEEEEAAAQEDQCAAAAEEAVLATPQCQNKAIAFIMGCPCSDEDSSQSEDDSSDDDDDGFDSEGSSDLSDSTDDEDDDEDSDGEADSEAERLWSSLCQSQDPYNPQNFTARLHTSSTPPRTIPASTPVSSAQSSPASSPDFTSLPLPSSSPPSSLDVWDDSTSASEVDEAESLRLWSSFSCSSDPYSPFNFQAPLRTRGPVEAGPRARTRAKKSPRHAPASPPEYRKEEAEERLDSGFSEPSTSSSNTSSTRSCSTTKKVRFCDDVEEFFASCGEEEEDRRGPWEELARDRCRFLRRCQEVEQSIAYCLQPQHRSLVYRRLAVLYIQDA